MVMALVSNAVAYLARTIAAKRVEVVDVKGEISIKIWRAYPEGLRENVMTRGSVMEEKHFHSIDIIMSSIWVNCII